MVKSYSRWRTESDGKEVVKALWEETIEQMNFMWEDPGADRTSTSQDQCAWHTGIMVRG